MHIERGVRTFFVKVARDTRNDKQKEKTMRRFLTRVFTGKLLVLAFLALVFHSSSALATTAVIAGGGESSWTIRDDFLTTNGLPTGGSCNFGGTQASILDAEILGQLDAFDFAATVWVNSTPVGGSLSVSGQTVTFAPVTIAGLTVQMQYEVLTTSATLRNVVTFTNPTTSDITVSVNYANNFGSDPDTTVQATSNGDMVFTPADRWIVTDDINPMISDPANTTVLYGPGAPAVTTSSVSLTVFVCAGPQGVLANYSITVPAGQTRALMFFHQINDTAANAVMAVTVFDTTPGLGSSPLVVGLTQTQLDQVLNWDFVPPDTDGDVDIDIQPGNNPNSINPKSKGKIPVAILTTGTFDATTVDPLSVRFGPNGAAEAHGRGHIEDADGDGDLDLVLHFKTQDRGIACGDTEASLSGETFNGAPITGSDSIVTVGCKSKGGKK